MTARIQVAIVGLGFMGRKWARALAEHPAAELALACDIVAARAQQVAETYGCRWSVDPAEAAADPRIDAVVICTPDHLHEEPTLAAIGASHAVAVEKPFAHNTAAAERIGQAADRSDVPVLAAHILRFEPRYAAMHDLVSSGRIGTVQAVRSERIGVLGDQDVLQGRVSIPLYYGTHEMDLARWYAGPISQVMATRSSGILRARGFDVDDLYSVTVNFANGAHGTSMLGWVLPNSSAGLSGFTVIGDEGYLRVDQGATGLSAYAAGGAVGVDTWYDATLHGRAVGALANEVDHFVQMARGERAPICTASDGVAAVRATMAIDQAATGQRIVTLEGEDR